MKTDLLFTSKRMKGLWKALSNSHIPLVEKYSAESLDEVLKTLRERINENDYLPSVPYGYLGIPKGSGVTRFLPVIAENDLLVYYSLTLALQDFLVSNIEGVFGAYAVIPKKSLKQLSDSSIHKEIKAPKPFEDFDWGYSFGNTLAQKAWFRDWEKYVEFLDAAIIDVPKHYILITSDIANFYDTINIDKLSEKIVRRLASGGADEGFFDIKDLLVTYLRYWDRRLGGYLASSKGIPQEIITDASRILANFYLNDFDLKFLAYCKSKELRYTRWADDIIVFGGSKKELEDAIHKASRFLLKDGLNLNSSKTKIYTKKEFKEHRALDFLAIITEGKEFKIERKLKAIERQIANGIAIRQDTVFKRLLTYAEKSKPKKIAIYNYIENCSQQYELCSQLNSSQLLKLLMVSKDHLGKFKEIRKLFLSKPYAGPKAHLIMLIWKSKSRLNLIGIEDGELVKSLNLIKAASSDSPIIKNICLPKAYKAVQGNQ